MFKGFLTGSGLQSVAAKLDVASNALKIDAAAIGLKTKVGGGDGPGAAAAVPAGSWLSIGVGDVGGTINKAITSLGESGATGGVDPATLMQGLQSQLGIDVAEGPAVVDGRRGAVRAAARRWTSSAARWS